MNICISCFRKIALIILLFSAFDLSVLSAADMPGSAPSPPTNLITENTITIESAATVALIADLFAFDFLKTERIFVKVKESDATHSIYSLIYRLSDIAGSTRRINRSELLDAKKQGVTPVEHLVAKDALAIVVHPDNPLTGLTLDQIRKIYSGTFTNWKQVGGLNRPIVLLQRESTSGTQEMFRTVVMQNRPISKKVLTRLSIRGVRSCITHMPDAIGFLGHAFVDKTVKALLVNGVEQSALYINDETYPLCRKLYMYTNGQPVGVLKRFVEYPGTRQGRDKLVENNFIPCD